MQIVLVIVIIVLVTVMIVTVIVIIVMGTALVNVIGVLAMMIPVNVTGVPAMMTNNHTQHLSVAPPHITRGYLILTEECNLRCKYCYQPKLKMHNTKMDNTVAKNIIDFLFANAIKGNKKEVHLFLFGGEPLLNTDVIQFILQYAKKLSDDNSINVKFSIDTNGTIYNSQVEETFQLWSELYDNLRLEISIDGSPRIQDYNRVDALGQGTSAVIRDNINYFKRLFSTLDCNTNILFHGTINKYSMPYLFESWKYYQEELKVHRGRFGFVIEEPWDDEDVKIYDEQLNFITTYMINHYNPRYLFPVKSFHPGTCCPIGKELLAFCPNGDIYACPRLYFSNKLDALKLKEWKIGSIFDITHLNYEIIKPFVNYTKESIMKNITKEPCQICPCLNLQTTGDIYKLPHTYMAKFAKINNIYNDYYDTMVKVLGKEKV